MTSDATVPAQPHIPEAERLTDEEVTTAALLSPIGPPDLWVTRAHRRVADAATAKALRYRQERVRVLRAALQYLYDSSSWPGMLPNEAEAKALAALEATKGDTDA